MRIPLQPPGAARILVVEDHPHIARILCDSLSQAGFDVVVVPTGARAVQAARTFRPDLVCLELRAPVARSAGHLQHLRESANLEHIPFILLYRSDETARSLSASSTRETVVAEVMPAFEDSLTRVVLCPFSPRAFVDLVGSLLARPERRRAPHATFPQTTSPPDRQAAH